MESFTGEYGVYIAPAFAISAALLGWMIADTLLRARKWRREAERLLAERDATGGPRNDL